MEKYFAFFPFHICHILTDNGLDPRANLEQAKQFTNRLLKSETGNSCQKPSKMDIKCIDNNLQHRLTAPFTPKTNAMVEKVNGTIKNNTILKTQYQSLEEMKNDLSKFLTFYNLYKRHGSIRKELKVKTPFDTVEK